jgi:hypothetical protein
MYDIVRPTCNVVRAADRILRSRCHEKDVLSSIGWQKLNLLKTRLSENFVEELKISQKASVALTIQEGLAGPLHRRE